MCVEDYIDALDWAEAIGGLPAMYARADANSKVLYDWMDTTAWVSCLAADRATRSNTSVCMTFADSVVAQLPVGRQQNVAKEIMALLDGEGVARDIGAYRDAPPGLRVWTGATVEACDLKALTPWLDWAFHIAKQKVTGTA
jgi:phosphoserine aminotransferase